ncbi:urease accessory protein UreD [Winogradskya humida]|uniref:Urease accessory protein UreD n=1 Tax=Winogradskya humida TaxID=113566 RepID=A0ABQ3ZQ54_9ACTN|nr:urease accessory protein UreD [Actinoplanes humidus]GIE20716.1 urease accessory protein UreD [Actinoplanes humidus]
MKASAHIVAESDGRGGTRPSVLRGESPLLLRRTGRRGGGDLTVHLVGGAAGPLRGDDLRLDIEVGPGARLTVRSVAAQLALPGRLELPASRLAVRATVAAGGTLLWAPEPLIAAAGCHHLAATEVTVERGGTLIWRDDIVCGRHAETSGTVKTEVLIRYAGRALYRHELAIGPSAPGWSGPAVLGGGRAAGTVVLAGPSLPRAALLGGDAVLMPLAGPGMLASAVGPDIRAVAAALDPLCVLPGRTVEKLAA